MDEVSELLVRVAERLARAANEDPEFRGVLHRIAVALAAATEPPPPPPAAVPDAAETDAPPAVEAAAEPPAPTHVALPSATGIELPVSWAQKMARAAEIDLELVETRCRLKADGARWAVRRQRLMSEGADFETEIEPRDRAVIDRARKVNDCFLWMNHPDTIPSDWEALEVVAGCFEALAHALALVRTLPRDSEFFEPALNLVAEAQSALRRSVELAEVAKDNDQVRVYNWLRQVTAEQSIYVQRYMRMDDPADPRAWPAIIEQVDALGDQLQQLRQDEKLRKQLVGKIKYHSQRIRSNPSNDDWNKVIAATTDLIRAGVPASNAELRGLIMPIIDNLPDCIELTTEFERAMDELDRFLASRPPLTQEDEATPSEDLLTAAKLLEGKTVLLIGGNRRPASEDALVRALRLKKLVWLDTRAHESIVRFEPYVKQDDVAVVCLAIRWASHAFGEVAHFCEEVGKPFVRLPAGYNPNQVAHQILRQCGERLARTT